MLCKRSALLTTVPSFHLLACLAWVWNFQDLWLTLRRRRSLGEGDTFGEFAFFTGVRQASSVQTLSVCRMLTLTRKAYDGVAAAFPLSARQILLNLQNRAQEVRSLCA